MQSLYEKIYESSDFLYGVELVSIRGSMAEKKAVKARTFSKELVDCPDIDWISITDNAGGNPQLAPYAIGKPILYAGKEVVIHMTCKDMNRNGLESRAWFLNSEGFHNILAMTGDYPVTGNEGTAKPVFDLDSVALISMLNQMNHGMADHPNGNGDKPQQLKKTQFLIGAVTTNFKLLESELVPQYLKLQKKVECGAKFIINQVGYDTKKIRELRLYMDRHNMGSTPLIGNVYVLNPRVAKVFNEGRIPGIIVTPELLALCQKHAQSPDRGRAFFYEFAAKQIAIYRGLGYRGIYLGGVYNFPAIETIMAIERSFAKDDWKQFVRDMNFSRPGEYFYYPESSGVVDAQPKTALSLGRTVKSTLDRLNYRFCKWVHDIMFTPGTRLSRWGAKLCGKAKDSEQGPKVLRTLEHLSKAALFQCKDCGDCSLPDIAFLCPESQCVKNQRNGPCGGTRDGRCEVDGIDQCIWSRAYERLKADNAEKNLLKHAPVVQNQGLRHTSSWANNWLGRDHASKPRPAQTTKAGPKVHKTWTVTGVDETKGRQPAQKEVVPRQKETEPSKTSGALGI